MSSIFKFEQGIYKCAKCIHNKECKDYTPTPGLKFRPRFEIVDINAYDNIMYIQCKYYEPKSRLEG